MGTRGRGRPSAARRRPTATRPRSLARDAPPSAPPTRTRPWSRTAGPAAASPPTSSTRPWTAGPGWRLLDVAVTTGAAHGTTTVEAQLDAVPTVTGRPVRLATMDAAYAITRVFAHPGVRRAGGARGRGGGADQGRAERPPRGVVPVRRFPAPPVQAGRQEPDRTRPAQTHPAPARQPDRKGFQAHRASATDCRPCPPRAACIGSEVPRRAIPLHKDPPALPRARRKHARWGERERSIYARHRIRAEGCHGEAKTWHGLARAVRRGLANVRIQAYLTAAVINLKRLAAALVTLSLAVLLATRPMLARQRT
jgi:Transposase DDE domain